jgi:hypothetical protein
MTIHRLKQLVTYQRLVGQDSHNPPTEHNMMIPDQQIFDK